jgi:hypothetical protein
MFFTIFSMNNILLIFYELITHQNDLMPWLEALNLICIIVGLLTFGMAVAERGMPVAISFKVLVAAYLAIYIMQCFSMLIKSNHYLIAVNIFDGWVKGGILLLGFEVVTEMGYPYSESLTSGFVLAIEAVIKWPIAVTLGILI